jgi:hypothetical protein
MQSYPCAQATAELKHAMSTPPARSQHEETPTPTPCFSLTVPEAAGKRTPVSTEGFVRHMADNVSQNTVLFEFFFSRKTGSQNPSVFKLGLGTDGAHVK